LILERKRLKTANFYNLSQKKLKPIPILEFSQNTSQWLNYSRVGGGT